MYLDSRHRVLQKRNMLVNSLENQKSFSFSTRMKQRRASDLLLDLQQINQPDAENPFQPSASYYLLSEKGSEIVFLKALSRKST